MDRIINQSIKKVKKGDKQAFSQIVAHFGQRVYQVVYRMVGNGHDAEEIVQEAFVRAYVNIDRYDMKRKFSTWLYRIATNLAIDRMRKHKADYYLDAEVTGTDGLTLYSQVAADETLPDEDVLFSEVQEEVQQAVMALSPKYRSAIVLKYFEDLSVKEISDILNLPVGTVKTRIHRGREALRKKLRGVQKG